MWKRVCTVCVAIAMVGCGPSQTELTQAKQKASDLEKQVAKLSAEIDELKNGADRLLTTAKEQTAAGQLDKAKTTLESLITKHPTSTEATAAKALLDKVKGDMATAAAEARKAKEAEEAQAKRAVAQAMQNMTKSTDEIKGITWVRHRQQSPNGKQVSLYFGTRNGQTAGMPLRMKIQYADPDWLFVNSVTIKADDQVINLGKMDFERDHSYGGVWEWADIVADHKVVETILQAKKVTVRFEGDKYYADFALPAPQQRNMREVFAAWKATP